MRSPPSLLAALAILLILPSLVSAADYRVTQSGSGADYSASQFNSLSGDYSDDTFYFSGTFSTRLDVKGIHGTAGHPLTLDGWEGGDCDPINSVCSNSAHLLQGMRVGNREAGPDYIDIQDFRMTKSEDTSSCFEIYPVYHSSSDSGRIDYLTIKRNYVYQTRGTMLYYRQGKYATIENNKFTSFGQDGNDATQGFNLIDLQDFVLRGNELGHNEAEYPSGCTSANVIEMHGCERALIEYNDIYGAPNQAGIAIKEGDDQSDIIFRFNKVHDNLGDGTDPGSQYAGRGIYLVAGDWEEVTKIYIYGNIFYDNEPRHNIGIAVGKNIHVWSNVVIYASQQGIVIFTRSPPNDPENVFIYNNIISRNGDIGETDNNRGGIVATSGKNINIKNNILWNNRPGGEGYKYNQVYSGPTLSSLEHNTYYHSLSSPTIYYDDAFRTLATMQKTYNLEDDSPAGDTANPGFTDPNGPDNIFGTADDDYTLDGILTDDGETLDQCFDLSVQGTNHHMCYSDALHPSTDWTTTPPTVIPASQSDHGSGWERGAYVYTGIPSPTYECSDSLDNDGDGLADLSDPGCSSPADDDETDCGDSSCEGGENCLSCPSDCGSCQPNPSGFCQYVEAESFSLNPPMETGSDSQASGGQYIHAPSGSGSSTTPTGEASFALEIPSDGEYYLWARIHALGRDNDAFYMGFDGSFAREYSPDWGAYSWIPVQASSGSGDYSHDLAAGQSQIVFSHGEEQVGFDVALVTDDPSFVPSGAPAQGLFSSYVEAESFSLNPPMEAAADPEASGGQYIHAPSGSGSSTTPTGEASFALEIPSDGEYYLWARLFGPTTSNDAMYLGIDLGFDRVYPSPPGEYIWVRAPTNHSLSAGQHSIQISHGEELARADRVFLTGDPAALPSDAPIHRADANKDGCVDQPELLDFISLWYLDSTAYPMGELMEAVGLWKSGAGCLA